MSIIFVKPLDKITVTDAIAKRIKDAELDYSLWKIVESVCEKFEGKKITKRVGTTLEQALPDYRVYYENQYGMYHLRVYQSYNDQHSFLIGYDSNPVINMVRIRDHNQCHELEKSRAEKMKSIEPSIAYIMVDKWNKALSELQDIHKWAERYEVEYISGFDLDVR